MKLCRIAVPSANVPAVGWTHGSRVGLVLLAFLCGCSADAKHDSSTSVPSEEKIAECDAYLASLSACLARSGTDAAMASARQELASRFTAAATGDTATRERFRTKCAEGQKLLTTSCAGTR